MNTAELSRRLENLIRIGTVASVDPLNARCRVRSGALLTDWLPWFAQRAGTTRTWSSPTLGEQVMIFSPSGEPAGGIVLAGIYAEAHPAPDDGAANHVIAFADGARVAYDHESGRLTISGIRRLHISAGDAVEIEAPEILLHGEVIHDDGALASNGIVLHTHTHPGTGGPQ